MNDFSKNRHRHFSMLLHALGGLILLLITVIMSSLMIKKFNWEMRWSESIHSAFGLTVMFVTILVAILGVLAWAAMLPFQNPTIQYLRTLKVKTLHSHIAYPLIIFSQVTILLGVIKYNEYTGGSNISLGIANISTFVGILAILEGGQQLRKRLQPLGNPQLSLDEFNERLLSGGQLVIFEELIIDISSFKKTHPGGV